MICSRTPWVCLSLMKAAARRGVIHVPHRHGSNYCHSAIAQLHGLPTTHSLHSSACFFTDLNSSLFPSNLDRSSGLHPGPTEVSGQIRKFNKLVRGFAHQGSLAVFLLLQRIGSGALTWLHETLCKAMPVSLLT